MAYPDPNLSDMSIGQLLKIIRDEVQTATPAIPKNIQSLEDSDSPLIYPNSSDSGQGLFYNSSTGKYEPTLVDAPNLAANIILASQLIAGDPNAARVEVGVDADSNTGIRSFDASSTNTFNIDAQDGSVYVKGRIDWGTTSRLLNNDIMELATQGGAGFQTPARVQTASKVFDGGPSGSNFGGAFNISWGASTSPGSLLLLVVVQRNSGGVGVPTLPTASGWTQVQTVSGTDTDGGRMRQTIFKIENALSHSGSESVDLTASTNTRYFAARMYEYSGVSTADVAAAANTGTGTSLSTSASGILTQAGELLFAAFGADNAISNVIGGGFSDAGSSVAFRIVGSPPHQVNDMVLQCAELVTTATTSQTATGSALNSEFWIAQLLTFKAAAATGSVTAPNTGIARVYTQGNAAAEATPHVATTSGLLNSVAMAPQGVAWRLDFQQVTVSIPSTAAGASGTIAVSLSNFATGDLAMWQGVNAGTAFTFWTDPVCTSAGSVTLRYHNTDTVTGHALATQTHSFLIIHRS